jgi:hypothetical protein
MNRRIAAMATAFIFGLLLLIGTFPNSNNVVGVLALNSPLSVPPRQGIAPSSFSSNWPYLPQLGTWAGIWTAPVGVYSTTFQVVPMLVKVQTLPTTATVQTIAAEKDHEYWLVFNECEIMSNDTCGRRPTDQAVFYHDQVLPLIAASDPNAKLIIGGSTAHECGLSWMTRFVQAYRSNYHQDPPRAGWHFHIYPDVVPNSSDWQPGQPCPDMWSGAAASSPITVTDYISQANAIRHWWSLYGSPNDEIWITETGCLVPWLCPANSDPSYLNAITYYFNHNGRWIDRYAWYTDFRPGSEQTSLMLDAGSGQLTNLGIAYSQVVPATHVPGFQYLSFLPILLSSSGASGQMLTGSSPFVSPLIPPSNTTFTSPLPIP